MLKVKRTEINWKSVTVADMPRLRRYYQNCSYRLCEYSAGVKLMWRGTLHPAWAEVAGCLVIRNGQNGDYMFDYPVAGKDGSVEAALETVDQYCMDHGIVPVYSVVPTEKVPFLLERYPHVVLHRPVSWSDYLYRAEDMMTFAGRRYSGQRNHINKFRKQYPTAAFCPITAGDEERLARFWQDYEAVFSKGENEKARRELALAKKMFRYVGKKWFCGGGLEHEGRLIAICLAERCGSTLIIHIEKALYGYEGVYPALVNAFAKYYGEGVTLFNREDDARDKGLRTSKLQYLPSERAAKNRLELRNELWNLEEIGTVETPRLTMTALRDEDQAAYNALCLDDERNRLWGYDYREDLVGELTEDHFLRMAREDFKNRQAVNFAVRLEGKLIGEAVLYRFDYKGGAELGCRIAPEYAGFGYGREAFSAVADWALYSLGLGAVVAKCSRENEASYKMLSSCMRPNGEDETFFYFKKIV